MKIKIGLLLKFWFFFVSPCLSQYSVLTDKIVNSIASNNLEIEKVQVYLNRNFYIITKEFDNNTNIESGKVILRNTSNKEKVIFKRNTPGVIRRVSGDSFFVDFEGDINKTILFQSTKSKTGNYHYYKIGFISGTTRKTGKSISSYYISEIQYDGHLCQILHRHPTIALKIKKSNISKTSSNKRKVEGVIIQ